jgi:transcriptional regulator with XRE-family HTH domain
MKNLKEAFGLQLREIRKSKNYTQEKLAEMLDLSPRQLIRIENGENFPSAETLGKISLLLNVGLEKLFNFKWDEDLMYLAKGSYNKPSLKIMKNNEKTTIKACTQSKEWEIPIPNPFKLEDTTPYIINLTKKKNKPVTVEYFENKKRTSIKTFYPNGKIEENISKDALSNNEQYNYIISKFKEISSNANKLNFITLAIDSLDNKASLEKLKTVIQGIELMH